MSIAQMYAKIANAGTGSEREASKILPIRDFNNWAKSALINLAIKQLKGSNFTVLDIACGKGGDLNKYKQGKISYYTGVDITLESLVEAMRRYNGNVVKNANSIYQADFLWADFFQKEVYKFIKPTIKFNIISCMFALHYAFQTREQAMTMFRNVSQLISANGIFIAVFPSKSTILARLENNGYVHGQKTPIPPLQNKLYTLQFTQPHPRLRDNEFGQGYDFQLAEAVEKTTEYLIDMRDLRDVLLENSLEIRHEFPSLEALFASNLIPGDSLRKFPRAMARSARVLHRINNFKSEIDEENFWENLEEEVVIGAKKDEKVPDIVDLKQIPEVYLEVINLYQAVMICKKGGSDGQIVRKNDRAEPRRIGDLVNLMDRDIDLEGLRESLQGRMWEPYVDE
ncbi:MRNA cap guanine-N7 methyltransferase [Spironucleus salmonicida]|uniref:mRNA (guanine-N(7))-methyltransferase n=1 Tax=Spironucleus salmonicida TaxID=348837 RepID=V6LWP1_9EUKA|nr:MRNA cap guanine-N7 methyltransferase [Spironucleus salmonicida]|eukprot:EST49000.1 mRNA cap guanine-N7 methyltransferase [Spironucleus salmonicida]